MAVNSKITIVIATRNRSKELKNTLSKLWVLYPENPIIVIDNSSTDHTCTVIRKWQGHNPHLSFIRLDQNLGAVARNYGVKAANTPYVAFNDDDSCWDPASFKYAEKILDTHPQPGGIAGRVLIGYEKKDDPLNRLLATSPIPHGKELPGPPVLGFLACGCIIRTEVFLRVGGFSRLLHFRGEERLLAVDLASRGRPICYVKNVLAYHYPSSKRDGPQLNHTLEQRNDLLFVWLRRPLRICFRDTFKMFKKGFSRKTSRQALLSVLYRLPAALYNRHQISSDIEQTLKKLETMESEAEI